MSPFLLFVLLALPFSLTAQEHKTTIGAPFIGLGAYSQQSGNAFAQQNNTAALALQKAPTVGVFGERRFMLKELGNYTAVAVFPLKTGSLGLQLQRFGFGAFNDVEAGFGYGIRLGSTVAVGGRVNYFRRQIPGYGHGAAVNGEAGLLLFLTPKLTAGVHTYNPVGGRFGAAKNEKLQSVYRFGLGYDVSTAVYLAAEVQKKEDEPPDIIGAIHYRFEKSFFAQLGISSGTGNVFAAAGIMLKKGFRLELGISRHPQLGFTPGIILQYQWLKNDW